MIAPLSMRAPLAPARPRPAPFTMDQAHDDVVKLTQSLVRVDSGPDNLVPGESQTVDLMAGYAKQAGLGVERFPTAHGKPMLIVTLPGSNPKLGAVGFVHHSDVVGTEGTWTLGAPFSGQITHDEQGREVLLGRGSIDTKGPAAQILVAMKYLRASGQQPRRTMKLFVFPDEESGGVEGAWLLSRTQPERFRDVQYWLVEGSGVLAKDTLGDLHPKQDAPYLAVAQKYTIPVQIRLKAPTSPDQAVHKMVDAMKRLDSWAGRIAWSNLGDRSESAESYRRLGSFVGGVKGWMVRHFWDTRFMQRRMGSDVAAANHTDFAQTDFYLSSNPRGGNGDPNVKPSSATMQVDLSLNGRERDRALDVMRNAAAEGVEIQPGPGSSVIVTLPQAHYQGGNHGSIPDREHDALNLLESTLRQVERRFRCHGWNDALKVTDLYTSKSVPSAAAAAGPVTSTATLDFRIAIDNDRGEMLRQMAKAVGPEFAVVPISGAPELHADVRRLKHDSPLFAAAEAQCHAVYGPDSPVLFGNTTASNDVRFLMDINPKSEALAFVPVLYGEHGAHSPDENVSVASLQSGVDWTAGVMRLL